MPGASMDSVSD